MMHFIAHAGIKHNGDFFCGYGNKHSGSKRGEEVFDQLTNSRKNPPGEVYQKSWFL
jgi:hypothetical protein